MIRRLIHALAQRYAQRVDDDQRLYYLRQLTQPRMTYDKLTVDPRGEWSPVQAKRVLAIINPQARVYGLVFDTIDVTTHSSAGTRYVLTPRCAKHRSSREFDARCIICTRYA